MIYRYRVRDIISIHPSLFKEGLERAAYEQLSRKYIGLYDNELGYIIKIDNIQVNPLGKVISEDGSSNHRVEFDVYTFHPVKGEIVEGEVVGIETFGIFVRIGPVDALVHKSVLMDDIVDINKIENSVVGRKSGRLLRKGDVVRARVLEYSPPRGFSLMKIALFMKSDGLGKLQWIEENLKKVEEATES